MPTLDLCQLLNYGKFKISAPNWGRGSGEWQSIAPGIERQGVSERWIEEGFLAENRPEILE